MTAAMGLHDKGSIRGRTVTSRRHFSSGSAEGLLIFRKLSC